MSLFWSETWRAHKLANASLGKEIEMKRTFWFVTALLMTVSLVLGLSAGATLAESPSGRQVVHFAGLIQSRPTDTKVGTWVISGQSVQVVQGTQILQIRGRAEVGAKVDVMARQLDNGQLEAKMIAVLQPAVAVTVIRGTLTEFGTDYVVVNGLRIQYNRETRIVGTLAVGAMVRVEALVTAAQYLAKVIEVLPSTHREVIRFAGAIESFSDTQWTVGGRQLAIDSQTRIIGTPAVGLQAKVLALVRDDTSLLALLIEVVPAPPTVEWTGAIRRMPPSNTAPWLIGDRLVFVDANTEIVGTPAVGATAHVHAVRSGARPLVATRIEIVTVTPTVLLLEDGPAEAGNGA
jgi:hypothetical protein